MNVNILLNYLKNSEWLKQTWEAAREKKKNSFPGGSKHHNYENTCAATASYRLIQAGLVDKFYMLTSDLEKRLRELGWRQRPSLKNIQPGDVIFMQDYNDNGIPDHVVIAISSPIDPPANYVMVVDNQNNGVSYRRNLGKGSYTPADFALYFPNAQVLSQEDLNKSVVIYQALKTLYDNKKVFGKEAEAILNDFANNPVLREIVKHAKEKLG